MAHKFPTPAQMVDHLNRFVRGQHRAKVLLATSAYNHFLGAGFANRGVVITGKKTVAVPNFGKNHLLLIGPTGSGKTYMVKLLAEFLNVPFCYFRANSLVKTGYVGTSIEQMIGQVYHSAGRSRPLAENSIVFLDEFDKLRSQPSPSGPDVSGDGAQQQLLPILEGVTVPASLDRQEPSVEISTTGMLFICAGAFVDLEPILKKRTSAQDSIGLRKTSSEAEAAQKSDDLFSAATPQDLIDYGMLPELIGRFAQVASVSELKTEDLREILVKAEDSTLSRQSQLFQAHGIDLVLTDDALWRIAERARAYRTGARALETVLKAVLSDVGFHLPDLYEDGVRRVTVTSRVVDGLDKPEYTRVRRRRGAKSPADKVRDEMYGGRYSRGLQFKPLDSASECGRWSRVQLAERLQEIKKHIQWTHASTAAQVWLDTIKGSTVTGARTALWLAEEVRQRESSLQDLWEAKKRSRSERPKAWLNYLDYMISINGEDLAEYDYTGVDEFAQLLEDDAVREFFEIEDPELECEDPFVDE